MLALASAKRFARRMQRRSRDVVPATVLNSATFSPSRRTGERYTVVGMTGSGVLDGVEAVG